MSCLYMGGQSKSEPIFPNRIIFVSCISITRIYGKTDGYTSLDRLRSDSKPIGIINIDSISSLKHTRGNTILGYIRIRYIFFKAILQYVCCCLENLINWCYLLRSSEWFILLLKISLFIKFKKFKWKCFFFQIKPINRVYI